MDISLDNPELYINRELSQLEFNQRVLAQALDPGVPLLERLRFLCICSTNLDEFFETRVARLKQQIASGVAQPGPDRLSPQEIMARTGNIVRAVVAQQYAVLNTQILPALAQTGIRFSAEHEWSSAQRAWIRYHFERNLAPVLTPFGLDPAHPFPRILNKNLTFVVALEGTDAYGRHGGVAVVQTPRSLPRLLQLPPEYADEPYHFVLLSSLMRVHVSDLFPGMRVLGCYQFRVTRNSELFVDEEEVDDLLAAVEGELVSRRYGDAVRLEVEHDCPHELANYLLQQFQLTEADVYRIDGPTNLSRLLTVHELVDRPDLKYPPFIPALPKDLGPHADMFERIRAGDILLHHPFQSFSPVIDFVRQAAIDPQVLAIKQTLYRTGANSALVSTLADAARAGKAVTVVIELRARYDEEANINLATLLQEAGAHVVYGVVGYKTHAKMTLVVRRENEQLCYYVHLGTGNYHARTARFYTDIGLFTCDAAIGEDVQKLFLQLTSLGKSAELQRLLQAPFTLHNGLLQRIEREAEHARSGRPARLIVKLNALIEPRIIAALYQASCAGVTIDLIVRGMCCLRPGIPGVSENIRVRSIVGRFLEHSRLYYFQNDGAPELYCASADWMDRNFFKRVEAAFPILDPTLRQRLLDEALLPYLADNSQAWELQSDGHYACLSPGTEAEIAAQTLLLQKLTGYPALSPALAV